MSNSAEKLHVRSADTFLGAVKSRRSIYALTSDSTISDSRIQEIVNHTVLFTPSAYNVQSARALILLRDEHIRLWEIVRKHMSKMLEEHPKRDVVLDRISKFRASHGTVLWFEDQAAVKGIGEKNPLAQHMATECESKMHRRKRHWLKAEIKGLIIPTACISSLVRMICFTRTASICCLSDHSLGCSRSRRFGRKSPAFQLPPRHTRGDSPDV